jgi:hypothetical protein
MPRYGFRKGAHVGVRVTQFTLTTILSGMGYGLAPSTYGISKIVTDHARTVITLSGEVITHKIAGAENSKCNGSCSTSRCPTGSAAFYPRRW